MNHVHGTGKNYTAGGDAVWRQGDLASVASSSIHHIIRLGALYIHSVHQDLLATSHRLPHLSGKATNRITEGYDDKEVTGKPATDEGRMAAASITRTGE
ncbi:hypothetical protein J6590_062325 [Homalodisca vitripennis]|nr:hypothetical protein J6590_062325 [Homalodisca vitripennis]